MINFLSLLVGAIVGGLFAGFRLPIPAPTNLAGVLGIVGIWLGYIVIHTLRG